MLRSSSSGMLTPVLTVASGFQSVSRNVDSELLLLEEEAREWGIASMGNDSGGTARGDGLGELLLDSAMTSGGPPVPASMYCSARGVSAGCVLTLCPTRLLLKLLGPVEDTVPFPKCCKCSTDFQSDSSRRKSSWPEKPKVWKECL